MCPRGGCCTHWNEARGVNVKLQNFLKNPSTSSDEWNVEDWWLQP